MNLLEQAPDLSYRNRAAIEKASQVSCYACLRTFPFLAIKEWTDGGQTALCPHCSIDAVLPGVIEPQTLQALKKKWFAETVR